MQAQVQTSDRLVLQSGQGLGERDGCVIVDLEDAQATAIRAALAQPNGGVTLAADGTIAALPAPQPVVLKQARGLLGGDAHTSGATSAEMFRATLPTQSQFNVSMVASGIALDNGAQRTVWVVAVVQRLNGGASVIGQTVIGNIASGAGSPVAATAFALTASGNDIVITVTGLASREIDWMLSGEYIRIRPSGLS